MFDTYTDRTFGSIIHFLFPELRGGYDRASEKGIAKVVIISGADSVLIFVAVEILCRAPVQIGYNLSAEEAS